ncbi:hypothetical protein [Bradyrhizobium sp. SUTN9-2]|uniref:hypothetical protein n=1 Tax=Bradyrhizobium sp. SUTN9-2 TaxID=1167456 RepID=UPI001FCE671A|nr:hypothetical protein [Bradyrhizobium sp. SUTN9-2]
MCLAVMLVDEAAFITEAELDDAFITDDDLLQAQKLSLIERPRSCSPMTLPERWMVSGKETFQLPIIVASIGAPSSMSFSRDSPRQITVFPAGGSLARAKYPPSRAILTT